MERKKSVMNIEKFKNPGDFIKEMLNGSDRYPNPDINPQGKETESSNSEDMVSLEDILSCPECHSPVVDKWSGVRCSKCDWWFCY